MCGCAQSESCSRVTKPCAVSSRKEVFLKGSAGVCTRIRKFHVEVYGLVLCVFDLSRFGVQILCVKETNRYLLLSLLFGVKHCERLLTVTC